MTRFNNLNIPSYFKNYWTKYPEGYTILEALLDWVGHVDKLTSNVNSWNDYLEEFVRQYDEDVQAKVEELLKLWKEDGTLDDILNAAILSNHNKLFSRKIYKQYPLTFPHYDNIIQKFNLTYIYPQGFTIDWKSKEIFIVYEPNVGGDTQRWIVVWGLDGKYKTTFQAGNSGGESIVIKYEDGTRYMYVKSKESHIGKYLLNILPAPMTHATPVTEINVNLAFNFSYRNGTWIVEQGKPSYGTYQRRTQFHLYNEDFVQTGTIEISGESGGYFSSTYADYIPKRQGIALGDNEIYQAIGGSYRTDQEKVVPYGYQGLSIVNRSGEVIAEALSDPAEMIKKLGVNNIYSDRVETESLHVSPEGKVYSLFIHLLRTSTNLATLTGIIIFEEMSADKDAIDFSDTARIFPRINKALLENGTFPMSDGKLYDPYTGKRMTKFEDILALMEGTELASFNFFTNTTEGITDINNKSIPESTYVTITNASNYTYFVRMVSRLYTNEYLIYGNPNERVQQELKNQTRQLTENAGSCVYKTGVDLNTIKETGWFYCDSTGANNPNKTYGFLEVMGSATTAIQTFSPITNDLTYRRRFSNNVWTEWVLI